MVTFDDLLEDVGSYGRCQKRIFALLCISMVGMASALSGIVFQGFTPNHWCRDSAVVDRRQACGWSLEHSSRLTVPLVSTSGTLQPSRCTQYEVDWNATALACNTESLNLTGVPVTTCQEGWEFDYESRKTIVTEFNLVCSDAWLLDMYHSFLGLGFLISSFAFGYFSDKYGRKISIVLANLLCLISGIAVAVAPNYPCVLLFRTILGFGLKGSSTSSYVLLAEIVGVESRRFVGILYQVFYGFCLLLVPLFAYFITDWRWLQVAFSVPSIVFICYYWFIPESPRWLLTKKNFSKGFEIMKAMAKENKKELSNNFGTSSVTEDKGDSPSASILDLFRTPNMRKYTLILMFNWYTSVVVYQGLVLRVGITGGNIYIDFLIAALLELPAGFLIVFIIERVGRRLPFASSNFIGGVACLITAFIPDSMLWVKMVVACLGRFTITMALDMVSFVNTELYPTSVRSLGVSICSTFSDIGSIVAPILLYRLAEVWQELPLIVFGVIALIAGGLVLMLPETKGVPLPDTIEEVEFPNRKKTVEETQEMATMNDLTDHTNATV